MAKEKAGFIKLQIPAGGATPAPPIGPALGANGVNIMDFCKAYNAATEDKKGEVIPVEITVYDDRTFSFVLKTPPCAELIKKYAKIKKGASNPLTQHAGDLTKADVRAIAEIKMPDLNANTLEMADRIVEGTARSMGVHISE